MARIFKFIIKILLWVISNRGLWSKWFSSLVLYEQTFSYDCTGFNQ